MKPQIYTHGTMLFCKMWNRTCFWIGVYFIATGWLHYHIKVDISVWGEQKRWCKIWFSVTNVYDFWTECCWKKCLKYVVVLFLCIYKKSKKVDVNLITEYYIIQELIGTDWDMCTFVLKRNYIFCIFSYAIKYTFFSSFCIVLIPIYIHMMSFSFYNNKNIFQNY